MIGKMLIFGKKLIRVMSDNMRSFGRYKMNGWQDTMNTTTTQLLF
jgi:hypothetical protein